MSKPPSLTPDPLEAAHLGSPRRSWSALRYFLLFFGLFALSAVGVVSFFGDNIRALFGAEAGGMVGTEDRLVNQAYTNDYPEDIWEQPYQGRDLQTAAGIRLRGYRLPPQSRLTGHALEAARASSAARAAAAAPSWQQSQQSVWRYQYPPGGFWGRR